MTENSPFVLNLRLLQIRDMAMMVDSHLAVYFDRPGERHQQLHCQCQLCSGLSYVPLTAGQRDPRQVFTVLAIGAPERQNRQHITVDQIRFAQTSRNVHPIALLVVQLQPPLDVTQAGQRIVTEDIPIDIFTVEPS